MSPAALAFALIQALPLPAGTTIKGIDTIDSDRSPMSIGVNVIAANVAAMGSEFGTVRVWRNGNAIALPDKPKGREGNDNLAFLTLGAISPEGKLYVDLGQPFSGAYSGVAFDTFAYDGSKWQQLNSQACGIDSTYLMHTFQADRAGSLEVTYEYAFAVDIDEVHTGEYAPVAARISNDRCTKLGRFNVRAAAGRYAVGYRGYLFGGLAPQMINEAEQRFVAVRVKDGKLRELGPGEAFAVTQDGLAVGSDAPPLHQEFSINDSDYTCCSPHPVAWTAGGTELRLAPPGVLGVAYAVDEGHRVVGSLIGRDGRHYAFLWKNGHLHLLDEMFKATAWRFEAAYGFAPDGAVVGAGTHDGVATAFIAN